MPSIFGHAIVGTSAARLASPARSSRKLYFLSLIVSIIPDLDVVTFVFGVQYDSLLGHRGIFHSITFALGVGWVAGAVYFKSFKIKSIRQALWILYFFLVTLSHPILDAMTTGGHGIALFSPFNQHRYFYFFRPIHVSPLSVVHFFSLGGIRVLVNESIIIGIPCLAIIILSQILSRLIIFRICLVCVSITLFCFFLGITREELIPSVNGVSVYKIEPTLFMRGNHGLDELPKENLPGKRLVLNYNDLVKYHLFNTVLVPNKIPWAGYSFPTWLGGATGRWQEPYLNQVWTSLWRESFLSKPQVMEYLYNNSSQLLRLSPTEKYDIAVGDYYLSATRAESTVRGRGYLNSNPDTPSWAGYCHSIGLASILEKEPKRDVKVINPDGYEVTFFPNDIKALLGIAYLFPSSAHWDLGNRCQLDGPKSEACIDINPAALVVALTNLIGLAKTTFIINKNPFNWINNAPIRKAEIKVVNPPYFPADRSTYFEVDDLFIKALVDVEIHLTVSKISSFLADSEEEELTYRATLGLDSKMNLAGGRWEDPFHHPDFVWGSYHLQNEPQLFGPFTKANVKIEWPVLKTVVETSASSTPQLKPILISKINSEPVMHGLTFSSETGGFSGRISYLRYADPIEIYGSIAGKDKDSILSVELIVPGTVKNEKVQDSSVSSIASAHFSQGPTTEGSAIEGATTEQRFFHFKAPGSIEDREGVRLRFNKREGSIEFQLPTKKKFESLLDPTVAYP